MALKFESPIRHMGAILSSCYDSRNESGGDTTGLLQYLRVT